MYIIFSANPVCLSKHIQFYQLQFSYHLRRIFKFIHTTFLFVFIFLSYLLLIFFIKSQILKGHLNSIFPKIIQIIIHRIIIIISFPMTFLCNSIKHLHIWCCIIIFKVMLIKSQHWMLSIKTLYFMNHPLLPIVLYILN